MFASFVYASCFRAERIELCDYLRLQDSQGYPWLIGGILILFGTTVKRLGVCCRILELKLILIGAFIIVRCWTSLSKVIDYLGVMAAWWKANLGSVGSIFG